MMNFKGTPGPWSVEANTSVESELVGFICEAYGDRTSFDEDKANANLIAAAPELLEAFQLLMSEQSGGDKSCGHNGFTCTCPYDKAKVAISKALDQ